MLKNSRSQKLKLKVFKAQTQEFLVQKLKKSETLGAILAQKFKIPMKIDVLEEILTNLSKTQGFFQNSSPKSLKNSRFRKVHLLAMPKKRLKKESALNEPLFWIYSLIRTLSIAYRLIYSTLLQTIDI